MDSARVMRVIHRCPACGGPVDCGMANGEAVCWCRDLPPALPVPADAAGGRCYCSDCLRRLIAERAKGKAGENRCT